MAAVARFDAPLFAAFTLDGRPMPADDEAAKLQKSLQTLFPDLLVHGTRSALLSMTTSLTKVSGQTHRYFARVSQMLAFERMMRSFMRLTAAMSPFPIDFSAANCWSHMLTASQHAPSPWGCLDPAHPSQAPSPWSYLTPQQPQMPPSPWSYLIPAPQPQAPAVMPFFPNTMQPGSAAQPQAWPDYSPLFIIPVALIAAAPLAEAWWGFGFPS